MSTKLTTGLNTTAAAAGAVDAGGLASNLNNASTATGKSVDAYKHGDVVNSLGYGTTAVNATIGAQPAATTTTEGTSTAAAKKNVSGTETTKVKDASG